MTDFTVIDGPLGPFFLGGSPAGLHIAEFLEEGRDEQVLRARLEAAAAALGAAAGEAAAVVTAAAEQMREYFEGRRTDFVLPLAPRGTAFQQAVWAQLRGIPHGRTTSYGAVARAVGRPAASRAVGAAVGRNPLAVIVPCHRVIGSSGALTGYASGLDRKRWLLTHEGIAVRGELAAEEAAAAI